MHIVIKTVALNYSSINVTGLFYHILRLHIREIGDQSCSI